MCSPCWEYRGASLPPGMRGDPHFPALLPSIEGVRAEAMLYRSGVMIIHPPRNVLGAQRLRRHKHSDPQNPNALPSRQSALLSHCSNGDKTTSVAPPPISYTALTIYGTSCHTVSLPVLWPCFWLSKYKQAATKHIGSL